MFITPRNISLPVLNLKNSPFRFKTRFTSFSFRRPFSQTRKVTKTYNTFASRMGATRLSFGTIQIPQIPNINV